MRINRKEAVAIVRLKYPDAQLQEVPSLNPDDKRKWYRIYTNSFYPGTVGQGSTKVKAWKSATEDVLHRRGIFF